MASVPTYDTPQVAPAALPAVRQDGVSPGLFSAAGDQLERFGKSVTQAADTGLDIATDMQTRQNADMIFRAETALKTEYIAFENSVRERRGQDAVGVTKEVADWWDKKAAEHADNLQNPAQKYLFNQQVQKLKLPSLDVVSNYEQAQRRQSLAESATASIGSSVNMAAANATNPEMVGSARQTIIDRTNVLARIEGWSADKRIAEMDQNLTTMHSQIIQNLADTDPPAAQAYFTKNKGEINGTQYDAIDKLLKHANTLDTAQKAVDALSAMEASETEGLEQIRKEYTGEARQHAELLWKERFKEKDQMREADQKAAADSAWDIYSKGAKLTDIPPSVWSRMDGKDRIAMQDRAEKDAEGKPVKTDFAIWDTLNQMSINQPAQFQKTDLRRYSAALSTDDLKSFGNRQREMAVDNGKGVAETGTQLSVAHNQLGWGDSDKEKKGAFDSAVYKSLEVERQKKGADLTYEERQKVIDRMMIDGKLNGSGVLWDSRGKAYEFADREDFKNFQASIPDTEKDKITAALKRAGKPVTDDAIAALYAQKNGLPPPPPSKGTPIPVRVGPPQPTPKPVAAPTEIDSAFAHYSETSTASQAADRAYREALRDPNVKQTTIDRLKRESDRLDREYKRAHDTYLKLRGGNVQ